MAMAEGLIAALEIVADKSTGEPYDASVVGFLAQACQDNGLIGRALAGTCMAFCPPLIITEAQVDELIDKLGRGLEQTLVHVQQQTKRAG